MNITLNTAIGNNNYIHINKSNNIRYTQTNLLNRTNACDEVSFTGAKKTISLKMNMTKFIAKSLQEI